MNCQYLECCNNNNNNKNNCSKIIIEANSNPFDLFTQNIVFEKGYCVDGYAGTIAIDDLRVFAPDVVEKDYAVGYFTSKNRLKYFITLGDKTLDEAIEIAKSKIDDNTIFVLIAPTYNTYIVGSKEFVIDKVYDKMVDEVFDEVNRNYLKYIFESVKQIVNNYISSNFDKVLLNVLPTAKFDVKIGNNEFTCESIPLIKFGDCEIKAKFDNQDIYKLSKSTIK